MKNAHERFGELVYIRRSEKTRTHIRVYLTAWIGEESKAHLVSVVGGTPRLAHSPPPLPAMILSPSSILTAQKR